MTVTKPMLFCAVGEVCVGAVLSAAVVTGGAFLAVDRDRDVVAEVVCVGVLSAVRTVTRPQPAVSAEAAPRSIKKNPLLYVFMPQGRPTLALVAQNRPVVGCG